MHSEFDVQLISSQLSSQVSASLHSLIDCFTSFIGWFQPPGLQQCDPITGSGSSKNQMNTSSLSTVDPPAETCIISNQLNHHAFQVMNHHELSVSARKKAPWTNICKMWTSMNHQQIQQPQPAWERTSSVSPINHQWLTTMVVTINYNWSLTISINHSINN